ncbi:hypothetical protein [Amycolatopsis sp. NPDC052450]|uniref:hypothetical protein n=1 Tax=Amycolatopsis sp. NPDC052450 TaxID=3363937 RepID=UPI0037C9BF05
MGEIDSLEPESEQSSQRQCHCKKGVPMRARALFLTLVSASVSAFVVCGTASAADSEFSYRYYDEEQELRAGSLIDPPAAECIEIPENASGTASAFLPQNWTDSYAHLYDESGCEGAVSFTMSPGGQGSDRVTFRSVAFP